MANYDPKIIQDHADQLYAQAKVAPMLTAYAAALVGFVIGLGTGMGLDIGSVGGFVFGGGLAALAGGAGFLVGRNQATRMQVAAQTALCQVAIEQALRKG